MKHALLGLLEAGARHGYELKTAYEEILGPRTRLNYGQVYSTLDRMRREGLVVVEVVNQAERPDKKVYSLTESGRAALHEWFEEPSRLDLDLRNGTFIKLALARRLAGVDPLAVIARERRAGFESLHEVERARTGAVGFDPTQLLLELAGLRLDAFLKWLERCERALGEEDSR